MIKEKEIEIKIHNNVLKYYKEKIGENIKIGDIIKINPMVLPAGSHIEITSICDICGNEKIMMYKTYYHATKNHNEICCCKMCSSTKIQNTIFKRYGHKHALQCKEFKNKMENTLFKNWGVKTPIKSQKIKDKINKTMIERYGSKHALKNENIINVIKEKIKIRGLESYKNKGINIIESNNSTHKILCENGEHIFYINNHNLINRIKYKVDICTICNPIDKKISNKEYQLLEYVKEIYSGIIIPNDRKLIGRELDIYLPDLKLAFEFNGIYWHNENNKNKNYHSNKTKDCKKLGINLVHIYEDDWLFKKDIIKFMIRNLFKKFEKNSTKYEIKQIYDNSLVKNFLEKNHIDGYIGTKIKIGIFEDKELVSLMCFGQERKHKIDEDSYKIYRFCNKINNINIIGGYDKIFDYFLEKYDPKEIIFSSDMSWPIEDFLKRFKLLENIKPDYSYVIDYCRINRHNFNKNILIKLGFDPNKTEHEIMLERKIYRIYDSGHLKFIYNKN